MAEEYYLAINGQPKGPLNLEELLREDLKPESLVWKTGLPAWIKAIEMPELSPAFEPPIETVEPEERKWFAMLNGIRRVGPLSASELLAEGLTPETPVWKGGMADWQPANTQEELRRKFEIGNNSQNGGNTQGVPPNSFANNPQYNNTYSYNRRWDYQNPYNSNSNRQPNYQQNPYHRQNPYDGNNDNRYRNAIRTNWLPWAIGATVIGLLCSCIGAIFGIIGIVQANKANTLYSQGFDEAAERANGNAKTMTIIGFVFAGIGIIATFFLKSFYSSFLNFY